MPVRGAPDFLRRHGAPSTPRELAAVPCLHYGHLASGNVWRLVGPDGAVDVRVNGMLCSNNGEVLRDAAVRGLGVVMLPTFIVGAELQAGRLVTVLPAYRAPDLALQLLYAPSRHLSRRLRLLVAFLYERFGDRPVWEEGH